MADNVTIPASGTGTATPVVATDDVSSVHYQKVKIDLGGDGVSLPLVGVDETGASAVDTLPVGGGTPHDSVDSGNPVKIGGKALSGIPGPFADGDRVNAVFSDRGVLAVQLASGGDYVDSANPLFIDANGSVVDATGSTVTVTDGLLVEISGGAVQAQPYPAGTATLANVNDAASSTTLIAANSARLGFIIVNDSTEVCYVKFGSAASSTSYTYRLVPGGTLENQPGVIYTGIITAIWASDAAGAARVTELSA